MKRLKKNKRKEESARMVLEEMKERPDLTVVEGADEMKRWRSLNPSEIDLCWKSLAGRMEEEVLDKYKVEESKKRSLPSQR